MSTKAKVTTAKIILGTILFIPVLVSAWFVLPIILIISLSMYIMENSSLDSDVESILTIVPTFISMLVIWPWMFFIAIPVLEWAVNLINLKGGLP